MLNKKIRIFLNNSFVKNVSTLAIGSVFAQIISIGGSFILARIYDADSFGTLSLFTSITTILAVVTTGRYEFAVLLPKKDEEAKKIVHLIWLIGFVVSICYFGLIFLFRQFPLGKFDTLVKNNIFLIFPLYTFFLSLSTSLTYWLQRKKNYKKITRVVLFQSITNVFFSIVLGLISYQYGLIIGIVIAVFIAILYILFSYKEIFVKSSFQEMIEVGKQNISFPKFMLLSDIAVTFSQQFVPILFTYLFSASIVGFYSMANRLLRMPSIILTSSISDVFRNEAIERVNNHGNCTTLYFKTLKKLVGISLPVFIIIYFVSPYAFTLVLGQKWQTSGLYAQILCIVIFLNLFLYQ